jgi:hypothetical protein
VKGKRNHLSRWPLRRGQRQRLQHWLEDPDLARRCDREAPRPARLNPPDAGGRVEDVVVLEVEAPRSWLRRSRRGLRYSLKDIPPGRLRGLICFAELAASPVEAAA